MLTPPQWCEGATVGVRGFDGFLNETAEEELATDDFFGPNLGQPTRFVNPRRAMLGLRLNLGR